MFERTKAFAEINRDNIDQNKNGNQMKINMFPKEPASQSVSGDKERKKKKRFSNVSHSFGSCRIASVVVVVVVSIPNATHYATEHTNSQSLLTRTQLFSTHRACTQQSTIAEQKKDERTNFMWLLHLLGISAIAYTSNVMLCLCACVKSMSPLKNSCSTYDDGHLQMHGVSTGLLCVL